MYIKNEINFNKLVISALGAQESAFQLLFSRLSGVPLSEEEAHYLTGKIENNLANDPDHVISLILKSYLLIKGIGLQKSFDDAIDCCQRAINVNNGPTWVRSMAINILGIAYEKGHGEPNSKSNVPEAIKFYDQAIKLGNSYAMNNRAILYTKGQGEPNNQSNVPEAIKLLDQAITLGNSIAMINRAYMYTKGQGEPNKEPNLPEAIKLLDQAIKRGNSHAMTNRAYMYIKGQGEHNKEPNFPAAFKLFDQAIKLGNCIAMNHRAIMYLKGQGEPYKEPSLPEAIKLFDQAIKLGNSDAMNYRASMYQQGRGEPYKEPNYPEAIKLYDQAIKLGHCRAMSSRATIYLKGQGEPNSQSNFPEAIKLYDQAIKLGDSIAMLDRAVMCIFGLGEPNSQANYHSGGILLRMAYATTSDSEIKTKVSNTFSNYDKNQSTALRYHHIMCLKPEMLKKLATNHPAECLQLLCEDTLLSLSEKQAILTQLWTPLRQAVIQTKDNSPALAALAKHQISIAQIALMQSNNANNEANLLIAQNAFELADEAISALETLVTPAGDELCRHQFEAVHEEFLLALCAPRQPLCLESVQQLTYCVETLLQPPHRPKATHELVHLLFLSEIPFDFWQIKYQLLLSLASRGDMLGQHEGMRRLCFNIIYSLAQGKQSIVAHEQYANTHLIAFDHLINIANTLISESITHASEETANLMTLKSICSDKQFTPNRQQLLLSHPLIKEKLEKQFGDKQLMTYEQVLYSSLNPEQLSVPFGTLHDTLLNKLKQGLESTVKQPAPALMNAPRFFHNAAQPEDAELGASPASEYKKRRQ